MRALLSRIVAAALLALVAPTPLHAAADHAAASASSQWLTAWAGPQQAASATTPPFALGTTIREAVWATLDGDAVRVKFSNAMGAAPLTIGAASIGIKGAGASVVPGTLRQITFGGSASVDVPIQGAVLSDAVDLAVPALTDLAISVYLPQGAGSLTQYPGSRKITYVFTVNETLNATPSTTPTTLANGYFVASVEVRSASARGVVAAVGDSIVAGGGSSAENLKWSDRLAA